ncbi:hypothetical protein M413DRAFT_24858 [Hebeloma cylindrosporum]|uniref:Uncharacterized protein n=1 Tax=Hebeloma cylindrosporum TaxID=76867 RepID=A0A0C3CPI3_HEBCY|nr:hypothetical protein M413DRAFT_24858 [Hebeloma cylindrosporum h7]
MDDLDMSSYRFPAKEHRKPGVFRHHPRCNVAQPHDDRHPMRFGSSHPAIGWRSSHCPLTLRTRPQLQDTTTTRRSHYHPKTKEIIDASYILRPSPPTRPVPQAPYLRPIPESHPKPRPTSLFTNPSSESPPGSPLFPLFRSSSRLSTSPDVLTKPDNRNPSPDVETPPGLPTNYTLQLNLPRDSSSLLSLSDYGFGLSDGDSDVGKFYDATDSLAPSSSTNFNAPPPRCLSGYASSTIEISSASTSQAPRDPSSGNQTLSSYLDFDFDTDSSDSEGTQVVLIHKRLTSSTNSSSQTSKKRANRPPTPRAISARSSRTFTRSPLTHQLRRSISRSHRSSLSIQFRTPTQQSHSRQSSRLGQNDVAAILNSLSPRAEVQQPQKQFPRRHKKLTPALAALTPPSLFARSTWSRDSNYAPSLKKDISVPSSSPTSAFDSNSGLSIKVDIAKVMSHPSTFAPAASADSPPFDNTVPFSVAEHWPRTPFVDTFQEEPVAFSYPSGEGIVQGINVVRKRERRQGWSGEWNQPCIEDVIQKLRTL